MNPPIAVEEHEETGEQAHRREHRGRFTRRSFLKGAAAAAGGLALYSGEIARHELSIEEHAIRLDRLPDAFRGMRIAQISDIHFESFTEPFFVREVVRRVNRLRPDMVVMTGDFITKIPRLHQFPRQKMPECAAILSEITCPLRYASLGNHDEIVGREYVIGPLEEHGIPVLRNRSIAWERDGKRIWLGGLGSVCTSDADPDAAIPRARVKSNEALILLVHEPDILPDIARYNVDLMLSGHTHGGQVRLPFLPPFVLPKYGKNYVEGLFRHGPTQLYVNRGIGTIELPFRLWCPPEITVLTLA